MSQEHVEVVRAVYEWWSEGDFRASASLFAPNAVFVPGTGFGDIGAYLGPEGVAEYTRSTLLEPWRHLTVKAEDIVAAGDSVIVAVYQRGIGKTSGVPTEMRYFQVWSFRGDEVIRLESFRERAEAFEAAGLRE